VFIAAVAPGSIREATARSKRTATRLLRCRARWRPWERHAFICFGGAEEMKGCDGDADATVAHAVAPVGAQAQRRRGFTAIGEVRENGAAVRSSVGSVFPFRECGNVTEECS
jgi:hypothetical protein